MGIKAPSPQGAFYMFISFDSFREKFKSKNIQTCEELADYLLKGIGIAILPGDDFYYPKESLTARITFVDYDGNKVLNEFDQIIDISIEKILEIAPEIKESLDALENFLEKL